MAFADSFVECMQNAGVSSIDHSAVTDASHFVPAVQYLQQWFHGLEDSTRNAIDQIATNEALAQVLAHAEVNVAPGLEQLLAHFDANVGWPLSTLIQWCVHCAEQAQSANPAY